MNKVRTRLDLHKDWVRCLAFSADGAYIASCSNDGTICLWSLVTASRIAQWTGHDDWVMDIATSPDGERLVSVSHDGTVRIWPLHSVDLATSPPDPIILDSHRGSVQAVAYHPQRALIVSAGRDEILRIWHSATGDCMQTAQMYGPYADMNISGVTGISEAQKESLVALGAIESIDEA